MRAAVADDEFAALCWTIRSEPSSCINSAETFSVGRLFTAHQAANLVRMVQELSPFDAMELAILLYSKLLNPESFQLVINAFEDPSDRDNLCHRLGITPDGKALSTSVA